MELDDIISLAEAAEELGMAPVTLRAQAAGGRLAARNVAGLGWLTTRQAVERYREEVQGRVGRPLTYNRRNDKIGWGVLVKYDRTIGDTGSLEEGVAMGLAEAKSPDQIQGRIQHYLAMVGMRAVLEDEDTDSRLMTFRVVRPGGVATVTVDDKD